MLNLTARDEWEWAGTVRSWGLEPRGGKCRGSWDAGDACGRCRSCATALNRPPDGADVEAWRAAHRATTDRRS